jgi:integrase
MASVHARRDRAGRQVGWEARWRDLETGKQRAKTFRRKGDASRHGVKMEAAKLDGTYLDSVAGKTTFKRYAEDWRKRQVHRESTAAQLRTHFTRHVYPKIGHRPLVAIRPSEIQGLVKSLSTDLAPATVAVVHSWVSGVFKAAVADRMIAASPCSSTKLPEIERPKVVPIPKETVGALADAIDARYRALIVLGAGTGMRIAEALGLTVDRIDFLRREIRVDRQLVRAKGPVPAFGPVKDRKNRPRTIPVGTIVLDELARHLATYGPGPEGLVFTTVHRGKVAHGTWSGIWQPAASQCGIATGDGFHLLRHFYVSTLIAAGRSVKEVQERLGHASASMTLDVYAHLWPSDEDQTRAVTDRVLGEVFDPARSRILRAEDA